MRLAMVVAVAFAAVTLTDCSTRQCSADTCAGCCQNDVCMGVADHTCGIRGADCVDCGAQFCQPTYGTCALFQPAGGGVGVIGGGSGATSDAGTGHSGDGGCAIATETCSSAADCCEESACRDGHCLCKLYGDTCTSSAACCAGNCVNGLCAKTAPGGACNTGLECSTGFCTNGTCVCTGFNVLCNGECVNLDNDNDHCGSCGRACAPGFNCTNRLCDCYYDVCGSSCVDTDNDPQNCGTCGHSCGPGDNWVCSVGVCKCPPSNANGAPLINCNGTCTALCTNTDCGGCGVACTGSTTCHCVQSQPQASTCY